MERIIHILNNRENGFTIVELMIVLALLGIVLALGYMYLDFGVRTFDRGEQRAIAQTAARSTSDFITTELRFAKEIIINPGGSFEQGYRYVYEDNDSIIFRDEQGNERVLASSDSDGMPYTIYFTSNVPDDVVIFDIDADNGLYTLDQTRVQALNLRLYRSYSLEGDLIKLNDDGGSKIKYKKPDS